MDAIGPHASGRYSSYREAHSVESDREAEEHRQYDERERARRAQTDYLVGLMNVTVLLVNVMDAVKVPKTGRGAAAFG